MNIVGIHDGHNASVALFLDNQLVFALQEERISREKNASGFPREAFRFMMDYFSLSDQDIDKYMLVSNHMIIEPGTSTRDKILTRHASNQSSIRVVKDVLRKTPLYSLWSDRIKKKKISACEKNGIPRSKLEVVEHHTAHANTGYYCSHFDEKDEVLVITADGGGDKISATVSIAKNGKLQRVNSIPDTSSLGYIYSTMTWFMGMVPNEHEYKLMGLAPYAKKAEYEKVLTALNDTLSFGSDSALVWTNRNGSTFRLGKYFDKYFKRVRFDLLAGGLQEFTENLLTEFIQRNLKHYNISKVCLSGGVFMNVKANQKIMELPEVADMFIMPSCGDETNAIGAGLQGLTNTLSKKDIKPLNENFCLGPSIDREQLIAALEKYKNGYVIEEYDDIEKQVAKLLANNEVVARVNGNMEFGARALGHRSILANPSSFENVKTINEMIKKRDFWMPFAGSYLDKTQHEYFINEKEIKAPYMILTFDTHKNNQHKIEGAIHPYDKTTRPQVVTKESDPRYWALINYFYEITNIGCVLNTSFNLHGLPLVYDAEDAMYVMENSGLKFLAIENFLVAKRR